MQALNDYYIMSGNTVTALWKDNQLTVLNEDLLPMFFRKTADLGMWLETRAIDSHRANSRLLKKALRLSNRDDISTVIQVNAATITDNYWVKPTDSDLTYEDVKYEDDYFSNLALKGSYNSFNKAANSKHTKTPELTNIGSFEKCWKLRDEKWWMLKTANHNELFSELFISKFGELLGMNMAKYEKGNGCIRTLDFTDNASVNFEPAFSFMGDNENYEDVIYELSKICPEAIEDYIKMIFLDTVVANPDRHTNNFGLLRDICTGKFIGLAPNFDNNMALISRGYPSKPKANDLLIKLFNEVLTNHPEYRKIIPVINENDVYTCIEDLNMKVKKSFVVEMIMSRYGLIR